MKVWVFEKKDGHKLMVTQDNSRIRILQKDEHLGIVTTSWGVWSDIDIMKANGELKYLYTFNTFYDIPSIVFFDLDRSAWCEECEK